MTPDINIILKHDLRKPLSFGAPLGAPSFDLSPQGTPLYVQRVQLDAAGYAPDGTYWGRSSTGYLYCAFNQEDEEYAAGFGVRRYVRAASWKEAVAKLGSFELAKNKKKR